MKKQAALEIMTLMLCIILVTPSFHQILGLILAPDATRTDKIVAMFLVPGLVIPALTMDQLLIDCKDVF